MAVRLSVSVDSGQGKFGQQWYGHQDQAGNTDSEAVEAP